MIPYLGSPAVCVIDDEPEDYEPIIAALVSLGIGCSHFRGRSGDPLPPKPLDGIKLVFTDLHLSGQLGKAAASHTANVIRKIVPADKGPILIVIWSKYASDEVGDGVPEDDQPTEADMFKQTLLEAVPHFAPRVIFTEMAKPKLGADRPAQPEWVEALKAHIVETIQGADAFQIFWAWEFLLRNAGFEVEESLIQLAAQGRDPVETQETLRLILRHLAQLQAGPDASERTIFKHLTAVFSQLDADAVEVGANKLSPPLGVEWLCEKVPPEKRAQLGLSKKLNGLLHTSDPEPATAVFTPGVLYAVNDVGAMTAATGFSVSVLAGDCYDGKTEAFAAFEGAATPVLLELSPACDFHQGNRACATFVAGLLFPASSKGVRSKDACKVTPLFEDRYQTPAVDVGVVFCARYRFTLPLSAVPPWLTPRIRFRDGLLTDLRNWAASQASRAGYLVVN